MPKIDFCQIDTKGSGSYCPVEIWPNSGEKGDSYGSPATKNNALVMKKAEVEYLNKLLTLQKEIREKYEPQLEENFSDTEYEPSEDHEELNQYENRHLLPGADNLYYT